MVLNILPWVALDLKFDFEHADSPHYHMHGPHEKLKMMRELGLTEVGGRVSPLSIITFPRMTRKAAAIPERAAFFAYAYTADDVGTRLASLDLFEDPWMFFFVHGGFCFFDEHMALLSVSAIVPEHSRHHLEFIGPLPFSSHSLANLSAAGRIVGVRFEAIRELGRTRYGWVRSEDDIHDSHGHCLKAHFKHGGFVYEEAEHPVLLALVPPTAAQCKKFEQGSVGYPSGSSSEVRDVKVAEPSLVERLHPRNLLYQTRQMIKRERSMIHWEEAQLHEITRGATRRRARPPFHIGPRTKLGLRRFCMPTLFTVVLILSMAWLARASEAAYAVVVTLIFYLSGAVFAWVPLRDVSLVLFRRPRTTPFVLLLLATLTPPLVTAIAVGAFYASTSGGQEAYAVHTMDYNDLSLISRGMIILCHTTILPAVVYMVRQDVAAADSAHTSGSQLLRSASKKMEEIHRSQKDRRKDSSGGSLQRPLPSAAGLPLAPEAQSQGQGPRAGASLSDPPVAEETAAEGTAAEAQSQGSEAPNHPKHQMKRFASIKIQKSYRGYRDRAMTSRRRELQQDRLLRLSWPILAATLVHSTGALIFRTVRHVQREHFSEEFYFFEYVLLVPCFVVVLVDLNRADQPRFSLSHGVFLIAILYPLAFEAGVIDVAIWDRLERAVTCDLAPRLGAELADVLLPAFAMLCHFAVFLTVTMVGMSAMALVATPNAYVHLLFPFQYFDLAFLYVFFSIRGYKQSNSWWMWVVQELLTSGNVFLRNSSIAMGIVQRLIYPLFTRRLLHLSPDRTNDPYLDALWTVRFQAELSVQYSLADFTALLTTHVGVTLFVWRDGYFSLQGTGILVRPCDLPNLWVHVVVVLAIRPWAVAAAISALKRIMRKLALGKRTIHGVSKIAAKQLQKRSLHVDSGTASTDGRRLSRSASTRRTEITEIEAIGSLKMSGVFFKVMKRWKWFVAVCILQNFAIFPVYRHSVHVVETPSAASATANITVRDNPYGQLPLQLQWLYINPRHAYMADRKLRFSYESSLGASGSKCVVPEFGADLRDGANAGPDLSLALCQDGET